jgi:hypothetical protein
MKSVPIAMIAASLLLGSSLVHATEPAKPHVLLQKTIGQPLHQAPLPTLGVLNSDGAAQAAALVDPGHGLLPISTSRMRHSPLALEAH